MKLSWRQPLRISRPRFWIYIFGPYLVGALIGARVPADLWQPMALVFGVFFLWPANLLIYGINDVFDWETDQLNVKKQGYETSLQPDNRLVLLRLMMAAVLPFLLFLPLTNGAASLAMWAFLFFALEYSAPPIRAKTKPLLDSVFNVLYICPGIFGYFLLGGNNLSWPIVAAGWLWTMAMHAYSAVPDITADRAAGLKTVATLLGFHSTLGLCLALYVSAAVLVLPYLTWLAATLGVLYAALMFLSLMTHTAPQLLRIYRWFPLVNTLSGMAIFFYVLNMKWG